MWIALTLLTAQAHASDPSVTAAVYPAVFDMISEAVSGQQIDINNRNISVPVSCFSALGVRNLNLSIPIDTVSLTPYANSLQVHVDLGTIRGDDWTIYAIAEPGTICKTFSGTLQWLELRDGGLTMDFQMGASDGVVDLRLLSTPMFVGDLDMDIEWAPGWADGWGWDLFPDDLILDLFENDIMDLLGDKAGELISEALNGGLDGARLETSVGDLDLDVVLDGLRVSEEGIEADAVIGLDWMGYTPCDVPPSSAGPAGRMPSLALRGEGDEVFGFGLTELFINDALYALWEDGLFCLTPGDTDALLTSLLPGLDGGVSSLSAMISLEAPPSVRLDDGAIGLTIPAADVLIIGRYNGTRVTILNTGLYADVAVELVLDDALGAITATLSSLVIDLDIGEANHLFSEDEDAIDNFEAFLEGWVPGLALAKVVDLPVLDVAGVAGDHAGRLSRLTIADGAMVGGLALYSVDDPEVDLDAPKADFVLDEVTENSATISMAGEDNQEAPLAYRYRVNRGPWSSWSLDESVTLPLDMGQNNLIEVIARDRWLNEDPYPAQRWIGPDDLETSPAVLFGCQHNAAATALGSWGLVALMLLAGRRWEL